MDWLRWANRFSDKVPRLQHSGLFEIVYTGQSCYILQDLTNRRQIHFRRSHQICSKHADWTWLSTRHCQWNERCSCGNGERSPNFSKSVAEIRINVKRQSNPCAGLDRPWGFQKVEAPRFQDSRHVKLVSLSVPRIGRLKPLPTK
jgi:hypothetical protein